MTKHIVACDNWTLPRVLAFKRCVEGVQKPDSGLSLVADDKARSSVWSVRTVDYIAALQKELMEDSRHWELVSEPRSHVIQECRISTLNCRRCWESACVMERDQSPVRVQYFEIKVLRHVTLGLGSYMPEAGTLLPGENYLLGSTSRTRFLPTSLSCMRDSATPPQRGVGNQVPEGCLCLPSATVPDLSPLCPCKRCGVNLHEYTTVIADAAQFYEEVSLDEIVLKWVTTPCKTDGGTRGHSFSWKAPARLCLCMMLYPCQKRGRLHTPTN